MKVVFRLFPKFIQCLLLSIWAKLKSKNLKLSYNNYLTPNCKFGESVSLKSGNELFGVNVGKMSYISSNCRMANAQIGKFCSIANNVKVGLGIHPVEKNVSTHPAFYSTRGQSPIVYTDRDYYSESRSVEIGNDVWIGEDVTILDGVKIGDGAVIGAKALVTKDIEPYSIVGGVPAKLIRFRFSREHIKLLLNFKWWGKDEKWIKENWKLFLDVDDFAEFIS